VLFEYWSEEFVSFSWMLPAWLGLSLADLFDYGYDRAGFLLLPLGLAGAVQLWRAGHRQLLGMLVMPVLLTLLAAALHRYPFGGTRLTLFLAPGCLLLVGAGLEPLRRVLLPRTGRAWLAVPALILAVGVAISVYHLWVPRYRGNMRPVVDYIRAHRAPDEPVYALRHVEFLVYWPDPDPNVRLGQWPEPFPREGRFWIALSVGQGRDKLRKELDYDAAGLGQPTSITTWRGGAALFYDRAVPPAPAGPADE
jgi:hypothetical protein